MKECNVQEEDLGTWSKSSLWPPCVDDDPEEQIEFRNTKRCTQLFIQKHAIILAECVRELWMGAVQY